ncbi:MAG: tetratricopeptide repeat protein [Spirochaetales bacterium]|nr:tetratricopeptide repeat protein [Spirochaetales bacterium]
MRRFLFCGFFLLLCVFMYSEEKVSELLKKAGKYEAQNQLNEALSVYNQVQKLNTDAQIAEWIILKLARLTPDAEQKLALYNKFIAEYSTSKFIKLAYYEMGAVYFLQKNYAKALEVYGNLLEISYGTSYFTIAGLYCGALYVDLNEPDKAIDVLHILLEEITTDEEACKCYFLLGKAYLMKNQSENAVHNFSVCIGTFPQAFYAKKAAEELKKMNQSETELKMVSVDKNSDESLLNAIESDIKLSLNISKDSELLPNGLYLQLGSYSEEKNALLQIEQLRVNKLNKLHIYPRKTSAGFFHKVVMGPFSDKNEMNDAIITLKDYNIDAFLIEIPEED